MLPVCRWSAALLMCQDLILDASAACHDVCLPLHCLRPAASCSCWPSTAWWPRRCSSSPTACPRCSGMWYEYECECEGESSAVQCRKLPSTHNPPINWYCCRCCCCCLWLQQGSCGGRCRCGALLPGDDARVRAWRPHARASPTCRRCIVLCASVSSLHPQTHPLPLPPPTSPLPPAQVPGALLAALRGPRLDPVLPAAPLRHQPLRLGARQARGGAAGALLLLLPRRPLCACVVCKRLGSGATVWFLAAAGSDLEHA